MRSGHGLLKILLLLTCLIFLVGCVAPTPLIPASSSPGHLPETIAVTPQLASPTSSIPQTPFASPSLTESPSPQVTPALPTAASPTPAPPQDTHYVLDAVLDYYQHTLLITETIQYVNNSPDALPDLMLIVEPNFWLGSFSLYSISLENEDVTANVELQDDQLRLPLSTPLDPGAKVILLLEYSLLLPQIPPPAESYRPQPYGYTTRQTNIVDWYPYIPPYRSGEGWLAHPSWGVGEHLAFDVADFDVSLTLAHPVKDLLVAASAPAVMDGDTYTYHLESVRSFALSASNEYQLLTTNVGGVDVYSYFFPWDKPSGEEVLKNTADALELYSRLLIPYPHASLTAVEADFFDGMEYDGLFFLSHGFYDLYDGTPMGYLTFIAAHETAHQWWYGLVANDQAMEPWLDEALCTYMERLFYENVYADYTTESGQSILDYWWFYRINFYDPKGVVDGTVYDYYTFISYRNAVYLRGAQFLEDLRSLIGDEAFFSFLKQYAQQQKYRLATATDFFTILRQTTDKDLSELIDQYFGTAR